MPFSFSSGDIFSGSPTLLINTANCVGVMGAGIAKSIKNAFPECVEPYQAACGRGLNCEGLPDSRYSGRKYDPLPPCFASGCDCAVHRVHPQRPPFASAVMPGNGRIRGVLHLATKQHWNSPSSLDDVGHALTQLALRIKHNAHRQAEVLHLPPPGCGNGGLSWSHDVKPLVEYHLRSVCEQSPHHLIAFGNHT